MRAQCPPSPTVALIARSLRAASAVVALLALPSGLPGGPAFRVSHSSKSSESAFCASLPSQLSESALRVSLLPTDYWPAPLMPASSHPSRAPQAGLQSPSEPVIRVRHPNKSTESVFRVRIPNVAGGPYKAPLGPGSFSFPDLWPGPLGTRSAHSHTRPAPAPSGPLTLQPRTRACAAGSPPARANQAIAQAIANMQCPFNKNIAFY